MDHTQNVENSLNSKEIKLRGTTTSKHRKRTVKKQVRKRQLKFMGHIVRKNKIELLSITGKIEGKRSRGRQRHMLIDRIIAINNLNCKPSELIHLAGNRGRWKDMIAQVT